MVTDAACEVAAEAPDLTAEAACEAPDLTAEVPEAMAEAAEEAAGVSDAIPGH